MKELQEFLRSQAVDDLLPWSAELAATEQFSLPLAVVEDTALALGLMPARYQRNRQTISVQNQLQLFRSRVAVLGLGGLGGYIVEGLSRLGVGTIVGIDPDIFQEHNLNRQLLATMAWLGRAKADAAVERVKEINPAVTVVPIRAAYTPETGKELLSGVHVVVDALDSIPTRLALAATCAELGIPLVHGAIAGWYGQVTTQFPGEDVLQQLYSRWVQGSGIESQLGNPSFTPALVASMETAEVCKILLGIGKSLRSRTVAINLLETSFEVVRFESHEDQVRTKSETGRPADDQVRSVGGGRRS
jgi:molybdopterin/thiamine biosynthesis adenylyltransferase